jgi:opacity protein-like surface antigen
MKKCMKVLGMIMVLVSSISAQAQDGSWSCKLTPYLWTMGIDGDIGVRNAMIPVDVKFTDAVKDLDVGGMLAMEARNGDWGILLDGSYLNLSDDADTAIGTFRAELEQWIVQGAAIYRIQQNENITLDLGAGVRYVDIDVDVNVPSERADLDASEGWVDPILVARLRMQFAEKCFGMLVGDIGGFGVESDLTWELTAATGYSLSETISLLLGYRYLDYDYEKDDFTYDVATSGIMLGVSFDL